jgi:hypothetical protein
VEIVEKPYNIKKRESCVYREKVMIEKHEKRVCKIIEPLPQSNIYLQRNLNKQLKMLSNNQTILLND